MRRTKTMCSKCGLWHSEPTQYCRKCLDAKNRQTARRNERRREAASAAQADLTGVPTVSGRDWRHREQNRRLSKAEMVQAWNRTWPVGTRVVVRRSDGRVVQGCTCCKAELVAGVPVVWVDGVLECCQLSRVEVRDE